MANIWKFDNANSLYYALLDALQLTVNRVLAEKPSLTIALPTGNTMVPFYHIIAKHETELQIHKWNCFNLDEYYPLPDPEHPKSFRHYLHEHFFNRLTGPVPRYRFINGCAEDPEQECKSVEEAVQRAGGLDIAVLGLGSNGHIAFNEPGTPHDSRTHLSTLHPDTLLANFAPPPLFTQSITMGIGTLLDAREIFCVALGKKKAQAVKAAEKDPISSSCPASALQRHSNVTWFLDQDAANLI